MVLQVQSAAYKKGETLNVPELLFQVLSFVGIILAFVLPWVLDSKSKTWFRGWGACEWLNSTCMCSKAKPRSDVHRFSSTDPEWLCDNHYEETLRIKEYVNRVADKGWIVSREEARRFKESGHRC